jgi:hypothetical protein
MHQCITQNESVRFAGVYLRGIFSIVMLKFHKNAQNELVSFAHFYKKIILTCINALCKTNQFVLQEFT